jgi:hypothetical protein
MKGFVLPEKQRRVTLVCLNIQSEVRTEDPGNIVGRPCVVICGRVAHRQELAIPNSTVVEGRGEEDEEEHNTDHGVGNGMPS